MNHDITKEMPAACYSQMMDGIELPSWKLYNLVHTISGMVFKFSGLKVIGIDNLPSDESYLISATHHNSWDAPALGYCVTAATGQKLTMMGKSAFFTSSFKRKFWSSIGGFQASYDNDSALALQTSLKLLDQDIPVSIFSEAGRVNGYEVSKQHPGVMTLAMAAGKKVVPAAIAGRQDLAWYKPRPLVVKFGEPQDYEIDEELRSAIIRAKTLAEIPSSSGRQAIRYSRAFRPVMQQLLDQTVDIYNQTYPKHAIDESA